MSQPTTVREYSGPRTEQPGAGPLITFPESHGLPVRLAASGWLGILCLPGSEFRARIAVGESRQNTSFGGPLSRSGLVGTGDVFFSYKPTALGTKPSTDGPAPCIVRLLESWWHGYDDELVCGKFEDGPTGDLREMRCGTSSTTGTKLLKQPRPLLLVWIRLRHAGTHLWSLWHR